MVLGACLLVGLGGLTVRTPRGVAIWAVVICVVLIAGAAAANSLNSAATI
jgi:hypothetical protein